jgi:hypothetical protein
MNYYLNLPLTGIRTSLVTLTVAADDVALTVNRSPAQILSVQVGPGLELHGCGSG